MKAKSCIIFLLFLAYSLTLVHSVVPHHHHQEVADIHSHSHHEDATRNHHDSDDEKSISHFFSEAVHHPSAKLTVLSPYSENILKSKPSTAHLMLRLEQIFLPMFKPPENNATFQVDHYSSHLFTLSLLRAPPVV